MDQREKAKEIYNSGVPCNCDLDNWEPDKRTGHSWVCRIHNLAMIETDESFVIPNHHILRDMRGYRGL